MEQTNEIENKINRDLEAWIDKNENPDKLTLQEIEQKRGELRIRVRGGYTVLSVDQIKELLKKAKEESKRFYKGKIRGQSTTVIHWELGEEQYDARDDRRIHIGFMKVIA